MTRQSQISVALRSLAVIAAYLACAFLLQGVLAPRMPADSWWLSLPLAFSAVQGAALILLLMLLLAAKLRRAWRMSRAARFEGTIRQILCEHAAGTGHEEEIRRLCARERRLVEICLAELLHSVWGEGKQRLARLAQDLGLFGRWKAAARSWLRGRRRFAISALAGSGLPEASPILRTALNDPDQQIRVAAARSLASASAEDAAGIFAYALSQPLLIRALLADDLKKFAPAVVVLPPRHRRAELLAALEICLSWRRTVRIDGLSGLLLDPDPEIAAAAVRMIPYAGDPERQEDRLKAALRHPAPAVRTAAASLLGHLNVASALADLARGFSDPDPSVLHACASALASLGPPAWSVLESEVLQGTSRARCAMEALEAAQTGRRAVAGS